MVLLTGFLAGLVDSIVGGGGLIMTPAMLNLFPGVPILNLIATQRTSSLVGTSVAAINYLRKVKVDRVLMRRAALIALPCSALGAVLAQQIDANVLKGIVLVCIAGLAIHSVHNRSFGAHTADPKTPATALVALTIGASAGFYNGLIGPGTGTILVFALVALAGLSLLRASATAKVINVAADLSSWLILMHAGFVLWPLVPALLIGNVLGSLCGSQLAMLRGNAFIRHVLIVVVFGLIARLGYDLWAMA